MKFNMGCGRNRYPGWHNVDMAPAAEPDEVWNLEQTPWPWPDNCAEEVRFIHSLEHLGRDPQVFLAIMSELYRISSPGCRIEIRVPHPRHDDFINDPTHVRPITPVLLSLFNREQTDAWEHGGFSNTPLARYINVDFRIIAHQLVIEETFLEDIRAGRRTADEVAELARYQNNVGKEYRVMLEARKVAS